MKNIKKKKSIVDEILKRLEREYPDVKCHLEFKNSFELLISTVLSAQCTDVIVNRIMVPLYKKRYKTAKDILDDGLDKFRENIKSITFYNNKSKAILELSKSLVEKYDGKVPDSMEQLTKFKGVGRKSANVILGNWFGKKDVIIVDTHLKRVSTRLGLVDNDNADKIELELKEIVPDEEQYHFSMRVGEHGRVVCKAKKPLCEDCLLNDI
jgi:endonuclease-3